MVYKISSIVSCSIDECILRPFRLLRDITTHEIDQVLAIGLIAINASRGSQGRANFFHEVVEIGFAFANPSTGAFINGGFLKLLKGGIWDNHFDDRDESRSEEVANRKVPWLETGNCGCGKEGVCVCVCLVETKEGWGDENGYKWRV